jgi:hypothetical protein
MSRRLYLALSDDRPEPAERPARTKESMRKTAYCYTCGVDHLMEEMRQIITGRGIRWRCIKTIQASRQARGKRQEFGAQTTARNKGSA